MGAFFDEQDIRILSHNRAIYKWNLGLVTIPEVIADMRALRLKGALTWEGKYYRDIQDVINTLTKEQEYR